MSGRWPGARAAALLALLAACPAVELAPVFGDHAVLQAGMPVPVWGRGADGERIRVRFAGQERSAVAADGRWSVRLAPLAASAEPAELVVEGTTTLVRRDLLVGEVWLCGGQSNMAMAVSACEDAAAEIAAADLPRIRHLAVPRASLAEPADGFAAEWTPASPRSAGAFTAAGFFFAREVSRRLRVPVGLVNASWPGTRIEPWIGPAGYRAVPELGALAARVRTWDPASAEGAEAQLAFLAALRLWMPAAEAAAQARRPVPPMPAPPAPPADRQGPTRMWNGMVHPLAPMALRGVLWYQGEANTGDRDAYRHKLAALIAGWRADFAQERLPFRIVQVAGFAGDTAGGDGRAPLREAQRRVAMAVPGCALVATVDIGDAADNHPRNKQDVGLRLALSALADVYGQPVAGSGPLMAAVERAGALLRVRFAHAESGLMAGRKAGRAPAQEDPGAPLWGWTVCGADRAWVPAEARIEGDSVVVGAAGVDAPLHVRYAYENVPLGANLYNRAGLPAAPFRSDP